MNARDELVGLLKAERWKRFSFIDEDGNHDGGIAEQSNETLADAILAAGYFRPRTITTAEELDALPVGSVVLHHGRAFQHYPAHPAPFDEYQRWKCGDGGFVRSTKDGSSILPATVLYEPQP